MSNFLTLADLKHVKRNNVERNLLDELCEVLSVAIKKNDLDKRAQKQVKEKVNPSTFSKRIKQYEEKNFTNYVVKDSSKIGHQMLIKGNVFILYDSNFVTRILVVHFI